MIRMKQPYAGSEWISANAKTGSRPLSALGINVADALGFVYRGIYHLPMGVLVSADWSNGRTVAVSVPADLCTWDGNELNAARRGLPRSHAAHGGLARRSVLPSVDVLPATDARRFHRGSTSDDRGAHLDDPRLRDLGDRRPVIATRIKSRPRTSRPLDGRHRQSRVHPRERASQIVVLLPSPHRRGTVVARARRWARRRRANAAKEARPGRPSARESKAPRSNRGTTRCYQNLRGPQATVRSGGNRPLGPGSTGSSWRCGTTRTDGVRDPATGSSGRRHPRSLLATDSPTTRSGDRCANSPHADGFDRIRATDEGDGGSA